jgi:hypothetical protein
MKKTVFSFVTVVVLIQLLSSCGPKRELPTSVQVPFDTTISFARNIVPMLGAHCAACHILSTIGPVPFNTYADVVAKIDRMIVRTQAGTMPPAGSGYAQLSTSQVDTLKIWRVSGERP